MSQRTDWIPSSRSKQLAMSKTWFTVFCEKREAWKMPEEVTTKLGELSNTAESEDAILIGDRTIVTNARLKTAFNNLKEYMRDIKKRYLYNPPLTDADLFSLGLRPKDCEPTAVNDPTGQAVASLSFPGRTQLMVQIKHISGAQTDARSYYGCRIYFGVYTAGTVPPASGKDLRESKFTRRKKELFTFQPEDTGKVAYFSLRYENSKGVAGPWGPLASAVIP